MAISQSNILSACEFIQIYLAANLDTIAALYAQTNVLDVESDQSLMGPSPIVKLKELHSHLTNILTDRFDQAVALSGTDEIVECFKLFPKIGKGIIGLDKYAAYISDLVSQNCKKVLKVSIDNNKMLYVDLITRLFENVASLIDGQEQMVEMHYGPGSMLIVIQKLQREVDIQSSILLNGYIEHRQIRRKLEKIKSLDQQKNQDDTDPREFNQILNELATISQKVHLFDRFLCIRAQEKYAVLKDSNNPLSELSKENFANSGKLGELIEEVMNLFYSLGDFYIRKSIRKALSISKHDVDSRTSTCVDDCFYIFKTALGYAVATGDPDSLCALINSIGHTLELEYMSVLQKNIIGTFSNSDTQKFLIELNNFQVSSDYIIKLVENAQMKVNAQFSHSTSNDKEKIKSCLETLLEYSQTFGKILKASFN